MLSNIDNCNRVGPKKIHWKTAKANDYLHVPFKFLDVGTLDFRRIKFNFIYSKLHNFVNIDAGALCNFICAKNVAVDTRPF